MLIFYFNSHAHVERDTNIGLLFVHIFNFNSHAHVERDVRHFTADFLHRNFNSHAHVERDFCIIDKTIRFVKFQLTRSRGA